MDKTTTPTTPISCPNTGIVTKMDGSCGPLNDDGPRVRTGHTVLEVALWHIALSHGVIRLLSKETRPEVCQATGASKGSVRKSLDRLETCGWVSKTYKKNVWHPITPNSRDGRLERDRIRDTRAKWAKTAAASLTDLGYKARTLNSDFVLLRVEVADELVGRLEKLGTGAVVTTKTGPAFPESASEAS